MSAVEGYEKGKGIDRTKTGILLLLIGGILGPVPLIGIIGAILAVIGVVLIILGRGAFSEDHSKKVVLSVGLWIFGFIIAVVLLGAFISSVESIARSTSDPNLLAQRFEAAFSGLMQGIFVAAIFVGLSHVLITYALQNQTGRLLLWAGFATSLTAFLLVYQSLSVLISSVVREALATGRTAPIDAARNQTQSIGIWGIFPALIYAGAYYLAWSRIDRGELPKTGTSPAAPSGPAAAP